MDITQTLAQLKQDPDFKENVGMVLIHNGVVRGWSRKDHSGVSSIDVTPDRDRIEALRLEYDDVDERIVEIAAPAGGNNRQAKSQEDTAK